MLFRQWTGTITKAQHYFAICWSAGSQNLPCANLFSSTVPPCIKESLVGWSFCFCQCPWKISVPWAFEFLSHHCQDLSLQVILTFSHSSGHFQVFLWIRHWECGLLTPLLYFTLLLEGKNTLLAWGCRQNEKKIWSWVDFSIFFPSQQQGRIHICFCTTFLNIVTCIIVLEGGLTSKLLCISHCSVVGRSLKPQAIIDINFLLFPFLYGTVLTTGQRTKTS